MTAAKTIAYQGEPGANSHIACAENYPDYTPLPCATFEDAFSALQEGAADLGMIPIENSIAGRVADIHNLLPASGLHIIGETFLPIHFQLLALPGARIENLKAVHSHVHALGQCRKIIRRLGLKPVVDHASFAVHEGEVVGIAGVEGNGQFELCEAILGLVTVRLSGSMFPRLADRTDTALSPRGT